MYEEKYIDLPDGTKKLVTDILNSKHEYFYNKDNERIREKIYFNDESDLSGIYLCSVYQHHQRQHQRTECYQAILF